MTLKTTGIDHVNLQVKNLADSIKFWQTLLGFEVLEEFPEVNGAIIGTKEAKLALYENSELDDVERQGFSHVGFHIENFDEAKAFCQQNDIPILYEDTVNWPNSTSLYIRDPSGYEVELTDTWGGGLL